MPTVWMMLLRHLEETGSIAGTWRYRRGDRLQRAQVKWLGLAGVGVPLYPLFCLLEIVLFGRPLWMSAAVVLVGVMVDRRANQLAATTVAATAVASTVTVAATAETTAAAVPSSAVTTAVASTVTVVTTAAATVAAVPSSAAASP